MAAPLEGGGPCGVADGALKGPLAAPLEGDGPCGGADGALKGSLAAPLEGGGPCGGADGAFSNRIFLNGVSTSPFLYKKFLNKLLLLAMK